MANAYTLLVLVALATAPPAVGGLSHSGRADPRAGTRCLRVRGGGFGSLSLSSAAEFGLDAAELAQLAELRSALGAGLATAITRNPDFATDDRLVRFLRANQNDVQRTVKAWPSMLQWRAEMGCDDIRAQVCVYLCACVQICSRRCVRMLSIQVCTLVTKKIGTCRWRGNFPKISGTWTVFQSET